MTDFKDDHTVIDQDRVRYYSDLYCRYHLHFSPRKNTKVLSYEFLGNFLFSEMHKKVDLNKFEWMFFPRAGYMLDAQHVAPELYLKRKYNLKNRLLDVKDFGLLCVYRSLQLVYKLNKSSLIASIENDTIFNKFSYVGYISLSVEVHNKIQILIQHCEFLYKNDKKTEEAFILKLLESFLIDRRNCIIFSHASFQYKFKSAFLYYCLSLILSNIGSYFRRHVLIVDYDKKMHWSVIVLLWIE